jgi:hypothetical protein
VENKERIKIESKEKYVNEKEKEENEKRGVARKI